MSSFSKGKNIRGFVNDHDEHSLEVVGGLVADTMASQGLAMVSVIGSDEGKTQQGKVDMSPGAGRERFGKAVRCQPYLSSQKAVFSIRERRSYRSRTRNGRETSGLVMKAGWSVKA